MPSSASSYRPQDLPPGIYPLAPSSVALQALRATLEQAGQTVLVLPERITDFLVADSVRREAAFDLENRGLTGPELSVRVAEIIEGGAFSGRSQQLPETLSGGERQLLALTVSIMQPQRFLLGRNCFDFLSRANMDKVRRLLAKQDKCLLERSARNGAPQWDYSVGKFRQVARNNRSAKPDDRRPQVAPWKLVIRGLQKSFPETGFTLRIPNLELSGLQVLGICGENGSGKSTLADCLTGMIPHTGRLAVQGIGSNPPRWGYLPQMVETATHGRSPEELIGRFTSQGKLTAPAAERLERWLNSSQPYRSLSQADGLTGYRLVLVAALLAGEYDVVLLDEPTYGLPAENVAAFLAEALRALGPRPLILISHDVKFLSLVCKDIIQLKDGEIDARAA
ncbi:MAG: ATP-binding cassette domain-containing protein [Candidatus Marinimicrobia bacterium]|nr:ATP-binding cassette domain-containing protein [Candidatus Neomarinimicrobiota bacterium]